MAEVTFNTKGTDKFINDFILELASYVGMKMRIWERLMLLLRNASYTSSAFFFVPAE